MKSYTVAHAEETVPLSGTTRGPWAAAEVAAIDQFNWYESGPRPIATVRALYDDAALYLQYVVPDENIVSRVTDLHGPVHTDSCVEFFATPRPGTNAKYFNFEVNACGTFKLAWMEPGWSERGIGREYASPELAEAVGVETSEPGEIREPADDDEEWWLAARLPFEALSTLTGLALGPSSGDRWRANFYRTGVESVSQEASWNPIGTAEKQFHSPGHFGWLVFE